MTPFTFNTTPSIVSGAGSAARLGEIVKGRLGERVLIITDAGVASAGLLEASLESLTAAEIGWSVFSKVVADPPEAIIRDALAQAKEFGAKGVIGLGGGSSLDVAKLVALLAHSGESLADIYGVGLAKGPRLPLALVPTTAGTGSEVTPISIVTTGASEKKGVVSPTILPDIAVLDADLTLKLPPHVTAATGVDAMVHAIEAYTSASANNNPVSRMLAMEALRLLGANIRAAVANGDNRDARGKMLLGSLLAGQAFANSPVAAVHALAYPIGGTAMFGVAAYGAWTQLAHVRTRVSTWIDPWSDPKGGYQLVQTWYALAWGGVVGTGIGLGRPDKVPVVESDFIFAAIGEELGLIGGTAILIAYLLIVGCGLRIATQSDNPFEKLLAAGLTALIGMQAFVILAGVIRVLPLTGVVLPFVSYGGSALVANYVLLALLIRISDGSARSARSGVGASTARVAA